jgi:hypothetical protein
MCGFARRGVKDPAGARGVDHPIDSHNVKTNGVTQRHRATEAQRTDLACAGRLDTRESSFREGGNPGSRVNRFWESVRDGHHVIGSRNSG